MADDEKIDYNNTQHLLIKARYEAAGMGDTLLCFLIDMALREAYARFGEPPAIGKPHTEGTARQPAESTFEAKSVQTGAGMIAGREFPRDHTLGVISRRSMARSAASSV